jgi:hypothetical protein
MRLEKITGPECKQCGCTDSEIVSSSKRWGQAIQKLRCNNCGAVWTVIVGAPKPKQKSGRRDAAATLATALVKLILDRGGKNDGSL